jgi:hypothetical protein
MVKDKATKNISSPNRSSRKRKTKKQNDFSNDITQNGGDVESFEVTTLDSVDVSKFSISKYINKNIDWGIMGTAGGAPPTDCNLM